MVDCGLGSWCSFWHAPIPQRVDLRSSLKHDIGWCKNPWKEDCVKVEGASDRWYSLNIRELGKKGASFGRLLYKALLLQEDVVCAWVLCESPPVCQGWRSRSVLLISPIMAQTGGVMATSPRSFPATPEAVGVMQTHCGVGPPTHRERESARARERETQSPRVGGWKAPQGTGGNVFHWRALQPWEVERSGGGGRERREHRQYNSKSPRWMNMASQQQKLVPESSVFDFSAFAFLGQKLCAPHTHSYDLHQSFSKCGPRTTGGAP